ncbi:hypothetical protein FGK63_00325 [Ruegeria sediminis]|uniref:Chemotaxis protein CheA n=1 Tax=Ruegeria sediminis TaxID=2583820 RepID=A0ABY2X367_9RHOB|nr:hypothetical protein [Ruegeria sediminis]TMV09553.1 hypothetical protein FGK63_00325 [Ruegeria sediminis]
MVQSNKVLTVSYGTFSCTLEGFDDSFETMKAIAEYFRDLAADDRYFGSEPPQPDAEMLARIAQRDMTRRVEARRNDDGIVLRATEAASSGALSAEPKRDTHRHGIAVASTHRPHDPQPAPPAAAAETPNGSDDLSAPELAVLNPAPQPMRAAAQQEYEEEYEAEPVASRPAPPADSIAAKLQRIRAVVSRTDESVGQFSEDEDGNYGAGAEPVDAIAAAFAAQPPVEPELEEEPEPEAAEAEQPIFAEEPETAEEPQAFIEDAQPEPAPEPEPEETPAGADAGVLVLESAIEEEDEDEGILFADLEGSAEEEDEDDDLRNILDEDQAAEQAAETAISDPSDEDEMETPAGTLTEQDEVNLLRKLADVEAELFARANSQSDAGEEDDLSRLMAAADEKLDDPNSDENRQTYSHLRTAVAATAAERTAKGESGSDSADEEYREDLASVVSPRRPEVEVTSRRPAAGEKAPLRLVAEQRIDTRDAAAEHKGPVQPRRVSSTADTDEGENESGFARFAEEQGAQSLSDLLEAAAAYLSFVEGQEQFSRPQLMNKVRSLQMDEFNREESLRSFGQLLRDGKIEKAGGGRFAASNQIGFRPDDKRAAG